MVVAYNKAHEDIKIQDNTLSMEKMRIRATHLKFLWGALFGCWILFFRPPMPWEVLLPGDDPAASEN